ncbi:MAG: RNA-binding protein, partial [Balneolaceae bacterium]
SDRSDDYFDRHYNGLWNTLHIRDITGNGHPDLVAGNFGLNSQLKATEDEPAELYYKDFDDNGTVDPILNFYIQGESYPFLKLDELTGQLPMMRSRFSSHESFSDATMEDLFTDEELEGAEKLEARHMETSLFINDGEGGFQKRELPLETQLSPVFAIKSMDYNGDGHTDLLLAGNMNQSRIVFGKYDANYGMLFRGDGEGDFTYLPQHESGFELWGDVRSIVEINDTLLFGINQKEIRTYRPN